MNRLVLPLVAFLASVNSNDVTVGVNAGRKIFDEKREASPALWRQTQTVTVGTNGSDVISQIVITDLRPDKDGDAEIVDGGEGHQNVTVELKSPTVLRGYDFQIQVFAVPEEDYQKNRRINAHDFNHPSQVQGERNSEEPIKAPVKPNFVPPRTNLDSTTKQPDFAAEKKLLAPVPISTDLQVNDGARRVRNSESHVTAKGLDITTPKSNPSTLARHENSTPVTIINGQVKNNQDAAKRIESHDATDKPKMLNNLPPYVLNRNLENATNFPMMAEKDLKTDTEQDRHVRDTKDEDRIHIGQNANLTPPNIGRKFDGATNDKSRNQDESEERKAGGNGHHADEQNRPLGVLPLNFGKSTENPSALGDKDRKSAIDARNGKALGNVHSHMHNGNDGKIPTYPASNVNLNQTKGATEKPRNARNTEEVEETKNVHKIPSATRQIQVNKETTTKNNQYDKKEAGFSQGVKSHEAGPVTTSHHQQDSTLFPRNTVSSTTVKSPQRDSDHEESDEDHDVKLKVIPRVVETHDDAAKKTAVKPVISTQ